jgi:hypothetical protein
LRGVRHFPPPGKGICPARSVTRRRR